MIEKYSALLISGVLILSGLLVIEGGTISAGPTRLEVDRSSYGIHPLYERTTTTEDDLYGSRYYAIMGDLILNSFTTEADWLSWEYSSALMMNMSGNTAFWSFDQGDAYDSSGNNLHGTLHGATSAGGISDLSQSLIFDGDDHVNIPHDTLLNITDEITVEAWIFPTFDDTREHMILSKGGNWNFEDPQCYELTIDKDRPLFQMKLPNSEDWYGAAPDEPITKNRWHHVAGVYDGSRFHIYIDGVNQTKLFTGWGGDYMGAVYTGGLPTSSHNVSIGRREPASWGSLYYKGYIDDVRIWDRALDAEEIRQTAVIPGTACLDILGTPDNGDVGEHEVTINVTDGEGRYSQRRVILTVENTPPNILNEDLTTVLQDEEYGVQYTTDEVGGTITWSLMTDAPWLTIDPSSGLLEGIPKNDDVGTVAVKVTVDDGNGGTASNTFELEIIDVNDPPVIITENIINVKQGDRYYVEYEGIDIDDETLEWSMVTDAGWLSLDADLGILEGTPTNDDVGIHDVSITATDPRGLSDTTVFQLEVIDVNDPPFWIDVPENTSVEEGKTYRYDINASDIDRGDIINYEILTFPEADISFNTTSGILEWTATRSIFSDGNLRLKLTVKASDGKVTISHPFHLDLVLNPSPTTSLVSPRNGTTVSNMTKLEWEGHDDGDDPLTYDVYLGVSLQEVISLNEGLRIAHDIDGTELDLRDLEEGATYYWTVIPRDRYSRGSCVEAVHGFYVNVAPVSDLISPEKGAIVPFKDILLTFHATDPDDDTIGFHIYISKDIEDVRSFAISAHRTGSSPFLFADPEEGATYYWTVIPEDRMTLGTCRRGIYEFRVNIPPVINEVEDAEVRAGSEVFIDVNGTDDDALSSGTLEFSLLKYPEGMTIDPGFGLIAWTPGVEQIGVHAVVVQLTDGMDAVNTSFRIEVLEAEIPDVPTKDSDPTGMIIAASVLLLLLIAGAILLFFLFGKKRGSEEADGPGPLEEENVTDEDPGGIPEGEQGDPIPETLKEGTSADPIATDIPKTEEDPVLEPPKDGPSEPSADPISTDILEPEEDPDITDK